MNNKRYVLVGVLILILSISGCINDNNQGQVQTEIQKDSVDNTENVPPVIKYGLEIKTSDDEKLLDMVFDKDPDRKIDIFISDTKDIDTFKLGWQIVYNRTAKNMKYLESMNVSYPYLKQEIYERMKDMNLAAQQCVISADYQKKGDKESGAKWMNTCAENMEKGTVHLRNLTGEYRKLTDTV